MEINTILIIVCLLMLGYLGFNILGKAHKSNNLDAADPSDSLPPLPPPPATQQQNTLPPPPAVTAVVEQQQASEQELPSLNTTTTPPPPTAAKLPQADPPIAFGPNRLWIAVHTTDQQQVAQILELTNTRPATWYEGLEERTPAQGGIFVTPAIDGWTLVVGWGFMSDTLSGTVSIGKHLIKQLSTQFGEAQYFCTHSRADYHCWMCAIEGEILRAYAWLGEEGETLLSEGEPTAAEPTMLVDTLSEEAQNDEAYFAQEDLIYPDANLVLHIAEQWSMNPNTLDKRTDIKALGLFGD